MGLAGLPTPKNPLILTKADVSKAAVAVGFPVGYLYQLISSIKRARFA